MATPTARPTNAIRISALCTVLWLDRISVSSRIGPNSPTAPAASRYVPKRVRISPLSDRMGSSVPIAVVASADPVYSSDSTMPKAASTPPSVYASASDSPQPTSASRNGRPLIRCRSIS